MVKDYWQDLFNNKEGISSNDTKRRHTPWYNTTNIETLTRFGEKSKALTEQITAVEFKEILGTTKANVTGGIDEILNEHVKKGPDELKEIVRHIINRIIETNTTPTQWKKNRIFMIYKKKDENDPYNYRGITLCLTLHKILTKVLARRLTS
jgi:hypothetical protein